MHFRRKLYFVTPLKKIHTICLIDFHEPETLQFGSLYGMSGNLYSKTSMAWVILDENGRQDHLLNIGPDEQIIQIHRSRWLLVQKPQANIQVLDREIHTNYTRYIYDIANSKVYNYNSLPEGRFICTKTTALDLASGDIIKNSMLDKYDIIDIEPLDTSTGPMKAELASSPIFSNSPIGCLNIQNYVYVLRAKNKNDYTVHIGPILVPGTKLNTILSFSGTYWHCRGHWIAYNNKIHNMATQKKSITVDQNTVSCGLTMNLTGILFVNDLTAILTYENDNFQAIIERTI